MFGLTVTMAWSCIRMHGFRCKRQLPILASFQHRLWEVMIKVAGSLRRSHGRPRMSSQQPASVRPSPSQWWREITLSLCDLRTRENNDMPVRPVLSLLPSNHTCLISSPHQVRFYLLSTCQIQPPLDIHHHPTTLSFTALATTIFLNYQRNLYTHVPLTSLSPKQVIEVILKI